MHWERWRIWMLQRLGWKKSLPRDVWSMCGEFWQRCNVRTRWTLRIELMEVLVIRRIFITTRRHAARQWWMIRRRWRLIVSVCGGWFTAPFRRQRLHLQQHQGSWQTITVVLFSRMYVSLPWSPGDWKMDQIHGRSRVVVPTTLAVKIRHLCWL